MRIHACFRCIFFSLLLAAGAGGSVAQDASVRDIPLLLDTLFSSDVVVARVGPGVVTVREFMLASLLGPAFVKRQPDTRRRTLEHMINEKLLALGAAHRQSDPRVKANLAALEGDMATEELYRDEILGRVTVTEREVGDAVRQERTRVALRWIYRNEEREAAEALRELRAGRAFDAFYRQEIARPGVPDDDRRLSATLFRIRCRNAPMAALVETLSVGIPSRPVKGPDGYYIVQMDSLVREVLVTGSAESAMRTDVRRALAKLKADSLSDAYVRRRMLDADPVIQRPVFDLLRAYLGSRILSSERFEAFGLTRNLREGAAEYGDIDRYGSKMLVQMRKGTITLRDFLRWYRLREANMTFRNDSPEGFFLSVEDVVWRMVRDHLLVNVALKRGLQNRASVAIQQRCWRDKLLYQLAKDSIKRTIGWTDSTLQAYHAAHPRSFRDIHGNLRQFEDVKDDVLREWYDLELKARTLRALNRLKREFPVTVEEGVLNSIPVDAENDPRAIEVYTVKKGGTFPHPAFPTIDISWQSWQ